MQPEVFDSRALALLNRLASRKKEPTPPPGRAAAPPISQSAADAAVAAAAGRSALVSQMKATGGVSSADRSGKHATGTRLLFQLTSRDFHIGRGICFIFHSPGPCAQP